MHRRLTEVCVTDFPIQVWSRLPSMARLASASLTVEDCEAVPSISIIGPVTVGCITRSHNLHVFGYACQLVRKSLRTRIIRGDSQEVDFEVVVVSSKLVACRLGVEPCPNFTLAALPPLLNDDHLVLVCLDTRIDSFGAFETKAYG